MLEYEEDDTHFCLKCHATILGLDNYVQHRKLNICSINGTISAAHSKSPVSPELDPTEEINLKADDFFSSLELQSSSKNKPVIQSTSGKNFSGILTRSKITAAIQASSSPQKEQHQEPQQSTSGKNVWIGGSQLKDFGTGDNQSRLIKAVANLERRKEAVAEHQTHPARIETAAVYNNETDEDSEEYDYEDEELSEEDAPPRNYTGGKWKPNSPVQWSAPHHHYNPSIPPPNCTGKWKPKLLEKDDQAKEVKYIEKDLTLGKTVPPTIQAKSKISKETDEKNLKIRKSMRKKRISKLAKDHHKIMDDSALNKTGIQYWCSTCNRKLSSYIVYKRHLKSELHSKRTKHEGEFDDGNIIPRSNINDNQNLPLFESKLAPSSSMLLPSTERKRIRRKKYEICKVCNSKVNILLIGKHLISHYHNRRGNLNSIIAKQLVLDNIFSIVLESPFQCSVCKFYCNTQEQFLNHWKSEFHLDHDKTFPGYYLCEFCKRNCENTEEMFKHLNCEEHLEVILAINGSLPIIIKKISEIYCQTCNKKFLLNIQLLKHCEKIGHDSINVNVFNKDDYECKICNKIFARAVSLQRHFKKNHKLNYYFCGHCNIKFESRDEAKKHRLTSEHRYNLLGKSGNSSLLARKCEYCQKSFANFLLLKDHLKTDHPDCKIRCAYCGQYFTVHQELSNHLKSKLCKYPVKEKSAENDENVLRCDKCAYSSNSTSELLFHVALHGEPLILPHIENDSKLRVLPKYKCPLCEKFFTKHSLHPHLRIHTKERPYVCSICKATFARKNNLLRHEKNHQIKRRKFPRKNSVEEKEFLCSTCGTGFSRKFTLQQHMLTHSGKLCKCTENGCLFVARKMSELQEHQRIHNADEKNVECKLCNYKGNTKKQLNRHMTIHEDTKKYNCNNCSFTGRTGAQLKRHTRLHTGAKPYKCPYCNYRCNNMENLRRHILSTTKHPGKYVYTCKFCKSPNNEFHTNLAKNFKDHLSLNHIEELGNNNKDAATYITGIYEAAEDKISSVYLSNDDDDDDNNEENEPANNEDDPVIDAELGTGKTSNLDQMLPMFVISKDDAVNIEIPSDSWNLAGRYDVDESGTLVAFQSAEEELFQEHF